MTWESYLKSITNTMDINNQEVIDNVISGLGLTSTQAKGARMLIDELKAQKDLFESPVAKIGAPTVGHQFSEDDVGVIMTFLQEYFSCFAIMGYDLNGNKFSDTYTPTDLSYDVMSRLMKDEYNEWAAKENFFKNLAFNINLQPPEFEDDEDDEY